MIRIPLPLIKLVSYLVEWAYMVLHRYGICQPGMVTSARIKYVTLNRTFSCNNAVEELGYKPTVTLMVKLIKPFWCLFIILFFVIITLYILTHFSKL
jgi:hypothetical protein